MMDSQNRTREFIAKHAITIVPGTPQWAMLAEAIWGYATNTRADIRNLDGETLQVGSCDSDDMATLIASALKILGIPFEFRVNAERNHIYVVAKFPHGIKERPNESVRR